MVADHPLLTIIEDPFAETDFESYRSFKQQLYAAYPNVQISRRFKNLEQIQQVTMWDALTEGEQVQYQEMIEKQRLASSEGPGSVAVSN